MKLQVESGIIIICNYSCTRFCDAGYLCGGHDSTNEIGESEDFHDNEMLLKPKQTNHVIWFRVSSLYVNYEGLVTMSDLRFFFFLPLSHFKWGRASSDLRLNLWKWESIDLNFSRFRIKMKYPMGLNFTNSGTLCTLYIIGRRRKTFNNNIRFPMASMTIRQPVLTDCKVISFIFVLQTNFKKDEVHFLDLWICICHILCSCSKSTKSAIFPMKNPCWLKTWFIFGFDTFLCYQRMRQDPTNC